MIDERAKTARKRFGTGTPPVYRIGLEWCRMGGYSPYQTHVLDYGCGYARFADEFIKTGVHYVATDLVRQDFSDQPLFEEELSGPYSDSDSASFIPAEHLHLCSGYDLVLAANVLNTQTTEAQLEAMIKEVWCLIDPGGSVLMNYPRSPRKLPYGFFDMEKKIQEVTEHKACMVRDYYPELVFLLHKPKF